MKKFLLLLICTLCILVSCESVSVTHEDGSHTVLYPDGKMEHIN